MQQQHHTNTQPQTQNHANQLSRRRHSIIRHPPDKTNPRGPRRRRRRRQTRQLFIVLVTFFVSFLWFGIGSVFSVLFFFYYLLLSTFAYYGLLCFFFFFALWCVVTTIHSIPNTNEQFFLPLQLLL